MKLLGKGLLYAVILILVLSLLALLGVNLYLRSPGIRDKVVGAFQERLGTKVSYESISYLPWRGLKVSHFEMPHHAEIAAVTNVPFARVDAVVAKVPLWSLVDRPIQLGEICAIHPIITTLQRLDGSVALPWVTPPGPPMVAQTATTDPEAEISPEPEVIPQTTVVEPAATEPAPIEPEPVEPSAPPSKTEIILAKFRVTEGEFVLLRPTPARAMVWLTGIESEIDLGALEPHPEDDVLGQLIGNVTVTQGEVVGVLQARAIRSEVHLRNDGALALPNIRASSDGGVIEGSVIGDLRKPGLPFQVRLGCRDLGLASMTKRAASRVVFSRGVVEALVEAEGFLMTPKTWRGRGEMAMKDAALARNGLLESLGRYIGVREFVELKFEEATAAFRLKGPVVWFEDIHWKTDNLEFKGLGAVGMNHRAKLGARLYFSQRVREVLHRIERQLPEQVIRKFEQVEGREDFYRDFVISGPLNNLKTNFIGSEGRTFEEVLELIRLSPDNGKEKQD